MWATATDLPKLTLNDMRQEVMQKVKFGDEITVDIPFEDGTRKVRIVAFYENHILCRNEFGYMTSILYYDLWTRLQPKHTNVKIPDRFRGVIN